MHGLKPGVKKGKNGQKNGIGLPTSFPLTSQQFSYEVFNTAGNPEFGQAVLDRDVNVALGDLSRAKTNKDRRDAMQRGLVAIDHYEQDGSPLPMDERTSHKEDFFDHVASSVPGLDRIAGQILGGQDLSRENASLLDAALRRRDEATKRGGDAEPGRQAPFTKPQIQKLSAKAAAPAPAQRSGQANPPLKTSPSATNAASAAKVSPSGAPSRTAQQTPPAKSPATAQHPGTAPEPPKSGATTPATGPAVTTDSRKDPAKATLDGQPKQDDSQWKDGTEMVITRGPEKGNKIPTCRARDKYGNVAVNYVNDEANKPAPDRRVHQGLHQGLDAVLCSDIVKKAGIKSITVNSTSGGEHDEKSNHYRRRAVDISMIDGKRVDHPDNAAKVAALQEAMRAHPKSNETYGPAGCEKHDPRTGNFTKQGKKIIAGHQNHIHFSVWQ